MQNGGRKKTKITLEDNLKFEPSATVTETIKKLGLVNENKKVDITAQIDTSSNVRDLIISEIFINNGHRSGVLANMIMQEYNDSEEAFEDVGRCNTVYKHKEARAGPIRVILSAKLHSWFDIYRYVRLFRKAVTRDVSSRARAFLTWTENPFANSGAVSAASNAM